MSEQTLRVEDKTESEWSDLIEKWYREPAIEGTLEEFLGLNGAEYGRLMNGEGLTKKEEMVDVKCITVDCELNDIKEMESGGPEYLGYDFCIDLKNTDDIECIEQFIRAELEKNGQDCINISIRDDEVEKNKLWTKQTIAECIKESYN